MIDLLIILLRPALLCVEAQQYRYAPFALLAWWVDVIIAHTTWALVAGWPKPSEWTISHTLERLCVTPGPDQLLYIAIARKINQVSPTGRHIKAVAQEGQQ